MANPWRKPLDTFHMQRLDAEGQAVVSDQILKTLNGGHRPSLNFFFFNVHVDVEHTSRGFEGQQAGFPNRFTRG